jgi:hypothetical protein
MCSRFARLFWVALDRLAYAVGVTRCRVVNLIYGPEPPTPADEKRDTDRKQLQKAFSSIDFDGVVITDEEQDPQTRANVTTSIKASGAAPPRSAASAHRPAP